LTIAEALRLTALVARKQPHRYGRFAARWLCLYLEEHEKGTLEDVALLVSNRDAAGGLCGWPTASGARGEGRFSPGFYSIVYESLSGAGAWRRNSAGRCLAAARLSWGE
jgi:hypothetical protein